MRIADWQELIVKSYDAEHQKWSHENDHNCGFLKDICEFDFSLEVLVFKDFSSYNSSCYEWIFKKQIYLLILSELIDFDYL